MFILIVILMALADLLFWWWADRKLRAVRGSKPWQILLGVLIGSQFLMLAWWVLFPGTLRGLGNVFWKPASAWLYMWHLLVLPATMLSLLVGYVVVGLRGLLRRRQPEPASAGEVSESSCGISGPITIYPSRRQVLTAAATFAPQVALAGLLGGSALQTGKFRVRRLTLDVPQLPRALDGLTIAHISDTHVGRFVGVKQLEAIVSKTLDLKPELVVFTGDLIDFNLADLPPAVSALREIDKSVPVAVCVGNHDLFEDGRAFRRKLRTAELGLMVDESMPLSVRGQTIELLGLDWGFPTAPRTAGIDTHMKDLLRRRRTTAFPILLAHHPHAFDPAAAAGIPLTLSGHTHGGQIMLTSQLGAGSAFKYISGHYQQGSSQLVVSNGVGNWFPLRINAPAEIIHLTLKSSKIVGV